MKKQYSTTKKARSMTGWHKHLKPSGKRRANKGTRVISKKEAEASKREFLFRNRMTYEEMKDFVDND
jgi:hypothetical protein